MLYLLSTSAVDLAVEVCLCFGTIETCAPSLASAIPVLRSRYSTHPSTAATSPISVFPVGSTRPRPGSEEAQWDRYDPQGRQPALELGRAAWGCRCCCTVRGMHSNVGFNTIDRAGVAGIVSLPQAGYRIARTDQVWTQPSHPPDRQWVLAWTKEHHTTR